MGWRSGFRRKLFGNLQSWRKENNDPKLWPDGVVVRPWQFKSRQSEQDSADAS